MKINTTLNRPNWLGDDVGGVYRTVTVTESTANYVVENGRKIIPSGTLIVAPYVSGLLLNDCDVTDGERVAQVLVRGAYIDSKLPTSVDGSRTILAQQGLYAIKYAETVISDSNTGSGGSGGLTPFKKGQTIKGITIDPNAKTNKEISDWIDSFTYGGSPIILVNRTDGQAFAQGTISLVQMENGQLLLWIVCSEAMSILFSKETVTRNESGITVPEGWNNMVEGDTATFTPITKSTTYNTDKAYEITTVADDFAFLNGTVVGAVESSGGGYNN